jgi:hypothetical protein
MELDLKYGYFVADSDYIEYDEDGDIVTIHNPFDNDVSSNTGDQFNPEVCIGLFGDKVDLLNGVNVGDELTVSINVSSREFNGKYYTQVDGWKIAKGGSNQQPTIEQGNGSDDEDDLPF